MTVINEGSNTNPYASGYAIINFNRQPSSNPYASGYAVIDFSRMTSPSTNVSTSMSAPPSQNSIPLSGYSSAVYTPQTAYMEYQNIQSQIGVPRADVEPWMGKPWMESFATREGLTRAQMDYYRREIKDPGTVYGGIYRRNEPMMEANKNQGRPASYGYKESPTGVRVLNPQTGLSEPGRKYKDEYLPESYFESVPRGAGRATGGQGSNYLIDELVFDPFQVEAAGIGGNIDAWVLSPKTKAVYTPGYNKGQRAYTWKYNALESIGGYDPASDTFFFGVSGDSDMKPGTTGTLEEMLGATGNKGLLRDVTVSGQPVGVSTLAYEKSRAVGTRKSWLDNIMPSAGAESVDLLDEVIGKPTSAKFGLEDFESMPLVGGGTITGKTVRRTPEGETIDYIIESGGRPYTGNLKRMTAGNSVGMGLDVVHDLYAERGGAGGLKVDRFLYEAFRFGEYGQSSIDASIDSALGTGVVGSTVGTAGKFFLGMPFYFIQAGSAGGMLIEEGLQAPGATFDTLFKKAPRAAAISHVEGYAENPLAAAMGDALFLGMLGVGSGAIGGKYGVKGIPYKDTVAGGGKTRLIGEIPALEKSAGQMIVSGVESLKNDYKAGRMSLPSLLMDAKTSARTAINKPLDFLDSIGRPTEKTARVGVFEGKMAPSFEPKGDPIFWRGDKNVKGIPGEAFSFNYKPERDIMMTDDVYRAPDTTNMLAGRRGAISREDLLYQRALGIEAESKRYGYVIGKGDMSYLGKSFEDINFEMTARKGTAKKLPGGEGATVSGGIRFIEDPYSKTAPKMNEEQFLDKKTGGAILEEDLIPFSEDIKIVRPKGSKYAKGEKLADQTELWGSPKYMRSGLTALFKEEKTPNILSGFSFGRLPEGTTRGTRTPLNTLIDFKKDKTSVGTDVLSVIRPRTRQVVKDDATDDLSIKKLINGGLNLGIGAWSGSKSRTSLGTTSILKHASLYELRSDAKRGTRQDSEYKLNNLLDLGTNQKQFSRRDSLNLLKTDSRSVYRQRQDNITSLLNDKRTDKTLGLPKHVPEPSKTKKGRKDMSWGKRQWLNPVDMYRDFDVDKLIGGKSKGKKGGKSKSRKR